MLDPDRTTILLPRDWLTLPCPLADAVMHPMGVKRLSAGELSLQGDEATPLLDQK